jgi:hypothetical protein
MRMPTELDLGRVPRNARHVLIATPEGLDNTDEGRENHRVLTLQAVYTDDVRR